MDPEAERQQAEERIRLYPGCEGIRVVHEYGEWRAVMPVSVDGDPGQPARVEADILVRRATLPALIEFFERHGGFASEPQTSVP